MNFNELNTLFYQRPISPYVMGVLNLDPESFYKLSIASTTDEALFKVEKMLSEGMDLLDIGAFSSKPGMKISSYDEERKRLIPIVKAIIAKFPHLIVSVDTMRAEIALEAIECGVEIINDISASDFDNTLPKLVAKFKKTYIAMHMKGLPENMMHAPNTKYENVMHELIIYFGEKLKAFQDMGLNRVIIDPGFGFSKSLRDNYAVLKNLNFLEILNKPVLVGLSRKSMIWKTIKSDPENALSGSLIAEFYATLKGCHIIRVHDCKETQEMLSIYQAILHSNNR